LSMAAPDTVPPPTFVQPPTSLPTVNPVDNPEHFDMYGIRFSDEDMELIKQYDKAEDRRERIRFNIIRFSIITIATILKWIDVNDGGSYKDVGGVLDSKYLGVEFLIFTTVMLWLASEVVRFFYFWDKIRKNDQKRLDKYVAGIFEEKEGEDTGDWEEKLHKALSRRPRGRN